MFQTAPAGAVAVPILSVAHVGGCLSSSLTLPCAEATAITVQVPFELRPNFSINTNNAEIVVSEGGATTKGLAISPVSQQIHVLTTCDMGGVPCFGIDASPLVTHLNGKILSADDPAHSGEVLVAYAVGLGATVPAMQTGAAATGPATVLVKVGFDFRANAAPIFPLIAEQQPLYAGVTPGLAGLYQVNFLAPALPPGAPVCGGSIRSNMTVTISGSGSFDGAGVCVQAQ
jgi:uncharacterized protein (TIGR03437 family)